MGKKSSGGIAGLAARHACKLTFALALLFGFFLVPKGVLEGYRALAIAFLYMFALTMACVAFSVRENISHAKGTGALSAAASALGFAALSACGSAACSTVGIGIFSLAVPIAGMHFLAQYGPAIVLSSIAVQALALHRMGCLRLRTLEKIASG